MPELRAPTASTSSISSPSQDEHYCDKWLRLGNLSPRGFAAQPLAAQPPGTRLFVSQSETLECRNWLQQRGLDARHRCCASRPAASAPPAVVAPIAPATASTGTKATGPSSSMRPSNACPDVQVMLCGVPAESDMCDAIKALCRNQGQRAQRCRRSAVTAPAGAVVDSAQLHFGRHRARACGGSAGLSAGGVVRQGESAALSPRQPQQPGAGNTGIRQWHADATPDISHINVQQVFAGWCGAHPAYLNRLNAFPGWRQLPAPDAGLHQCAGTDPDPRAQNCASAAPRESSFAAHRYRAPASRNRAAQPVV